MKFSYYLYLIVAIAACFQFYFNRLLAGGPSPVRAASGQKAEMKAEAVQAPGKAEPRYQAVKMGFKRRAKYLNLKDPE